MYRIADMRSCYAVLFVSDRNVSTPRVWRAAGHFRS